MNRRAAQYVERISHSLEGDPALFDALKWAHATVRRWHPPLLDPIVDRDDLLAVARLAAWKATQSYSSDRRMSRMSWVITNVKWALQEECRKHRAGSPDPEEEEGGGSRPPRPLSLDAMDPEETAVQGARALWGEAPSIEATLLERLQAEQEAAEMARRVAALPDAERSVIRGLFYEERTGVAQATVMGCGESWVSLLKRRALRELRRAMEQEREEGRGVR